jgi:PEP-CTERM motif
MKKLALLLLLALLFFTAAVYGDVPYFYGGDIEPGNPYPNAILNENVGDYNPYLSATYQNFYALSNITVTGLFTNNLSNLIPTSGYWEIRSGVSEGNGGTLVASGTGAVTNTPTGRSYFGYDEYTNLVSDLSVSLATGQYWFAVVPACSSCEGAAYNGNTFGTNSIGKSDLNLEYFNSPINGINFINPNDNNGHFPTFTSGVYANPEVPEPGSLVLMGTGIVGLIGMLRHNVL